MPTYGYDGPVTSDQWAKMQKGLAVDYAVETVAAGKVTANSAGCQIAAGQISGWGVTDILTATTQVNLTAPTSGSSWWMICARRNWSTQVTTFVAIAAGGSRPATLPTRQITPGGIDEQPLALVGWTAGQAQPTNVADLRAVGMAGEQLIFDAQAMQYLTRAGRRVNLAGAEWVCGWSGSALVWSQVSADAGTNGTATTGTWRKLADGTLICSHERSFPANANTVQTYTWTYPVAYFVDAPSVFITPDTTVPQNVSTGVTSRTTSSVVIRMYRSTDAGTTVGFTAIGRWK